jgi:putative DNA methylase
VTSDKRLIEDFLPIQAISAEASREKSVRKGHISTLHLWWARRPLVACRAAVYGALVPASRFIPENGPDNKKQSLGRANAAKFIERLCKYPGNPSVIKEAQRHILEAHAMRLSVERGESVSVEDIENGKAPRPKVLDMFAGGGAIPLEALRLGCEAYALDLNPVAHIIQLCTLVYPQKYGKPDPNVRGMTGPVLCESVREWEGESVGAKDGGLSADSQTLPHSNAETLPRSWGGLADEVRYWGEWVLKKVKAEIGDLYPLIPDPEYNGNKPAVQAEMWQSSDKEAIPPGYLVPVAYLWTRTVRCKNPACGATVPLVRQTWLCKKKNRYVALKMVTPKGEKRVRFEVVESRTEKGLGFDPAVGSKGGNATCPFCGTVADSDYVKAYGIDQGFGCQGMAIVCVRPRTMGKVYIECAEPLCEYSSIEERLATAEKKNHLLRPYEPLEANPRSFDVQRYGFTSWDRVYTDRQLLTHLSSAGMLRSAWKDISKIIGDSDLACALFTSLALSFSRCITHHNSFAFVDSTRETIVGPWGDGKFPMSWDFAEANIFSGVTASYANALDWACNVYTTIHSLGPPVIVTRGTATNLPFSDNSLDAVITDPPYYDSVSYSNLADAFYVWLKRYLGDVHPEHFASELTPKKGEAIAAFYRHGDNKLAASKAYENLMGDSLREARRVLKPGGAIAIVYAHKTTLGWATLVDALRSSGFTIVEAWPLATEMKGGRKKVDKAMLASSIFLVARKREGALTGSYEDEVRPELERIVRERVDSLWKMGITGADLVIAAVGAGLRAFTKFARVEYANGEEVPAEKFLAEVEGVVLETLLEKIFGVSGSGVAAVDGPSRFYVLWRYAYKAAEMEAGEAIVFTYGQNVELDGQNGLSSGSRALVEKKKGKYRLLDFSERGDDEKLGMPKDDGKSAPLIDILHRILWLVENEPRKLNDFLDEARPDRERLRLVAQALAGTALAGRKDDGPEHTVATTPAEAAALNKLVANWRALIDQRLSDIDSKTGQIKMQFRGGN